MSKGFTPSRLLAVFEAIKPIIEDMAAATEKQDTAQMAIDWVLLNSSIEYVLWALMNAPNQEVKNMCVTEFNEIVEYLKTVDDLEHADFNKLAFMSNGSKFEA